jgi:hypothetical protein
MTMAGHENEDLILEKMNLIDSVLAKASEENEAIKSKNFEKAVLIDSEKNNLINRLMEIDRMLLSPGAAKMNASKNTRLAIENINSSLNNLIKIEKENEILISGQYGNVSGNHINAYKTYKQSK